MADSRRIVDLLSIEANETQHDAVLDYYGRRLATCSSDKTIKIFEVEGEKHTLVETLRGYVVAKWQGNTVLMLSQA
jgi:protein transport protein SEC13